MFLFLPVGFTGSFQIPDSLLKKIYFEGLSPHEIYYTGVPTMFFDIVKFVCDCIKVDLPQKVEYRKIDPGCTKLQEVEFGTLVQIDLLTGHIKFDAIIKNVNVYLKNASNNETIKILNFYIKPISKKNIQ